jgi:hypothetical protein
VFQILCTGLSTDFVDKRDLEENRPKAWKSSTGKDQLKLSGLIDLN